MVTDRAKLTLLFPIVFFTLASGSLAMADQATPAPEKMVDEGNYQGIPWLSGGVGEPEREYLSSQRAEDYNLKLEFATTTGAYLGNVMVNIARPDGQVVVEVLSEGPWFMTKLAAGKYRLQVSAEGKTYEEEVDVPTASLKTVVFNQWTTSAISEPGPGL